MTTLNHATSFRAAATQQEIPARAFQIADLGAQEEAADDLAARVESVFWNFATTTSLGEVVITPELLEALTRIDESLRDVAAAHGDVVFIAESDLAVLNACGRSNAQSAFMISDPVIIALLSLSNDA